MGTKFKQKDRKRLPLDSKRALMNKGRKKCVYCGCRNYFALTIDHKNPLARGGKDEVNNMQIVCGWCNTLKADLNDKEFKECIKAMNTLAEFNKIHATTSYPEIKLKPYNTINKFLKSRKEIEEFNDKRREATIKANNKMKETSDKSGNKINQK